MKKYSNVFILFLLTCSLSCSTKQNYPFSKSFIQSISKEDQKFPSRFSNILFFCKCQNNEILSLSVYEIREIYLSEFKRIDYSTFLTDLLNQKQAIHCRNQDKTFKINDDVKRHYSEMGVDEFVGFYCTNLRSDLYVLKNNISTDQRNTIFYFLFMNNYLTSFDDYSGTFKIRKGHAD